MVKVVDRDRNGKLIPDISKIKFPIEKQKRILDILNKGDVVVNKDTQKDENKVDK